MFSFSSRLVACLLLLGIATAAYPAGTALAQSKPSAAEARNTKVDELLKLMDDPEVRAALEASRQNTSAQPQTTIATNIGQLDAALRNHLTAMVTAMKQLPAEMTAAGQAFATATEAGEIKLFTLLLVVLAPAAAAEWLVRRRIAGRAAAVSSSENATREVGDQLFSKLAPLLAFAAVGIGIFLAAGSSPLIRKIVGVYLIALIAGRILHAASVLVLERAIQHDTGNLNASADAPFMPEQTRSFWERRIAIGVTYLIAAWATLSLLPAFGFSLDAQHLLGYLGGIGMLAIGIEIIWNMPRAPDTGFGTYPAKWLLTIYLVLLWLIWAAGANVLFWLGLYAFVLPSLLSAVGKASRTFLTEPAEPGKRRPLLDVLIARGARALIVLLAVAWIAFILRMNPGILATSDDVMSRIMRSLLRAVLILVAADLVWQVLKTWIDGRIASDVPAEGAPAASRLRTLLPIFRNALAVLVITIAGLMILAEFGVQIGPLIAGAGIFGVAIGFGSQTLVKDIVSGIFYLMDDAFRVGEYIQSGSYKGTVEDFSLRSVRLRHHRGPVYTVPFGTLGAVQNMSRDWVIDKFVVRFPFETNINTVKKLTKAIGAELEADPELGPIILQTVKMKGVEQIGDYGIDISFGFMTKPGYQTSVRRRAYSMMKDTFAANGIEFARPSVHVGSDDHPAATGAASTVVARQKAAEQAKA